MSARRPRASSTRRGFAVASVVVLLLMLNILAFGTMDGARDDGGVAALRIETLRALYAAESGVTVVIGEMASGRDAPTPGTTIEIEGATVEIEEGAGEGEIRLQGRAGMGRRRIAVETGSAE